jgi:hypothetical protein
LNALLRHGHRLTETEAVALLHRRYRQAGKQRLSDPDLQLALHAARNRG